MRIHVIVKAKGLDEKVDFGAPSVLEDIYKKCPMVKELFCHFNGISEYKIDEGKDSRLIRFDSLKHKNSRLRKMMSHIDKLGNKSGFIFTKRGKIKHTDPRLKYANHQISIFEQPLSEYDSLLFDYINNIKKLLHISMYRKKDLEVNIKLEKEKYD